MTPDPYAPHLRQADEFFARGEIVRAGQIWQAILKQQPGHAAAREGLLAVKQRLLALREAEAEAETQVVVPQALPTPVPPPPAPAPPEAPPPSDQVRVITGSLDPDRLVAEGCTLYDMGQIEDALQKWEKVLGLDPAHALARSYADGARRELGLSPLPSLSASSGARPDLSPDHEDADKLLREAVQLYDMGLAEEAISKWERVLALEPHRQEVEGYLRQARAELGRTAPAPSRPAPIQAPAPAQAQVRPELEALDLKLRQAEHLLNLQRHEEAAYTFQQALSLSPGDPRALQGLERCRRPETRGPARPAAPAPAPAITLDPQGRIAMAVEDPPAPSPEPQGVEPPASLVATAPAPRTGLSVPARLLEAVEALPWLKDRRILAAIGGGLLLIVVVLSFLHSYRKDQALKDDVRAARAAALAPVAQQAEAPSLAESPAALREEVETTMDIDPLRAYLRAETLVRRHPDHAAGAQLLEKARAGLPGGATGASLPEFQKHMQSGNLEAALKVMDALLRDQPGDADLRARAGRLHLALCSAHAGQNKWDEAREDLLRGRALFPDDPSWQARLRLLEQVKAMPKDQRSGWIGLLG